MDDNGLSLENVFRLRGKAFVEIRRHTAAVNGLAAAIADVDAALQSSIDEKNIDAMQGLITAARLLSDAMQGGAA